VDIYFCFFIFFGGAGEGMPLFFILNRTNNAY
jgi:hypothetical protein